MKHMVYLGVGWKFQLVNHRTKLLLNIEGSMITWSKFLINVLNHGMLLVGS